MKSAKFSPKLNNNLKFETVKPASQKSVAVSVVSGPIVARDIAYIAAIVAAQQAAAVKGATVGGEHTGDIQDVLGTGLLGGKDATHRIGGMVDTPQTDQAETQTGGFSDPLAGHQNRPRLGFDPTPQLPSSRDLASDEGGSDSSSHSSDGSDRSRPYVWVERQTERSSSDGSQTWGSTMYRDYSGNFWRSDYHVDRDNQGGVTTKETVFDNHGDAVKTTLTEAAPDGTVTETTTDHATGQTTVVHPVEKPEGDPEPDENQSETTSGHASNVAPRGWYNPVSGVVQNPGLATGNNQVNPGPNGNDNQQTPLEPVYIDPKILVVNPSPESPQVGNTEFRDVRHEVADGSFVDPPRPQ